MAPSRLLPRHLVIFARAPRRGRVKSRLARDIGWGAATAFHRRAVARLLQELTPSRGDCPWRLWLALTPDRAVTRFHRLFPGAAAGCSVLPQGQGDLGARMGRVFASLPPGPAVIVGADIPGLGRHHVASAFSCLETHGAVIGPADDGGYWLLGLRRRPRPPAYLAKGLQGIRWSGVHALADTLAAPALSGTGGAVFLETLSDIDDGRAWRAWRQATRQS